MWITPELTVILQMTLAGSEAGATCLRPGSLELEGSHSESPCACGGYLRATIRTVVTETALKLADLAKPQEGIELWPAALPSHKRRKPRQGDGRARAAARS
jgi:hypothetical protein